MSDDLVELMCKNILTTCVNNRDRLTLSSKIFNLDNTQIRFMFNPPIALRTIYSWRNKNGSNVMSDDRAKEFTQFIKKNYKGRNPEKNLHRAIERLMKATI